jgi:hypothetical protein
LQPFVLPPRLLRGIDPAFFIVGQKPLSSIKNSLALFKAILARLKHKKSRLPFG